MKKSFILLAVLGLTLGVFAFEYTPKNTDANPFGNKSGGVNSRVNSGVNSGNALMNSQKQEQASQPEMREIKNLTEYFRYLPAEVHRHWTPYKADVDYEVAVRFVVHRDGKISDLKVIGTNYPAANTAVLKAVKDGAPYQPLPLSYAKDSVKAQIVLEYHAKND